MVLTDEHFAGGQEGPPYTKGKTMRIWKRLMIGVCVMAAAFAGGGASQWLLAGAPALGQDEAEAAGGPGVVDVRELRLVDDEGTVRGSLRVTEGGSGLVLCDSTGRARTVLGVQDAGMAMSIFDAASQLRGALVVNANHRALSFFDAGRTSRAIFGVGTEDGPMMSLFDTDGRPRIAAGVMSRQDVTVPTISLHDGQGQLRIALGVHPQGSSISIKDDNDTMRFGVRVTADGPEIALRDADGETDLWSAPQ